MEAGESSRRKSTQRETAHGWTEAGHLVWREMCQALPMLSISSGKQPREVWRMLLDLRVLEVLFTVGQEPAGVKSQGEELGLKHKNQVDTIWTKGCFLLSCVTVSLLNILPGVNT